MDGKIVGLIVVAVVVVAGIAYVLLPDGEGNGGGGIMFEGQEYTWDELAADYEEKTIDGNTGISLSAILNGTDFADLPEDDKNDTLFNVVAKDGWQKNVSWNDMQQGILMEEDTMTYFAGLPGAYKIRDLASIEKTGLGPLAVIDPDSSWSSSAELTWDGIFAALDSSTFSDGNQDYEGINLTAVLEHAGFDNLENCTCTITGVDGYSKTVNWTDVQNGYLVLDKHMSVFPDLSNKYKIRNIIRIEVVEI